MRKLATAALGYSGAVYAAQYVIPRQWQPYAAAVFAVLSLISLILKGDLRLRALLIAVSAAIGFAWSWGHYRLVIEPAEELAGQEMTITARVLDYAVHGQGSDYIFVKPIGQDSPGVKTAIYTFDSSFPELTPGDIITAPVKIASAVTRYGDETNMYTSRGIFALAYLKGDVEVTGRWRLSFLYFPKQIAQTVKRQSELRFPSDVSALMKALLTGDTTGLSGDRRLYSAMGTTGVMHAVAISGTNVAYIVGFVRRITGRRRRTAFICIPLIIVYIFMSGGSPSVVRAGFMQILLLIAPLLRRENDEITSMSAVLALLLLINPSSAASVGLQLSFAAMAGVLAITPRVYKSLWAWAEKSRLSGNKYVPKPLRWVINSFSSTIGAIAFSTPLVAVHFSYVSLYGVLTNMLCLFAMSWCFVLGYLICLAGMIWGGLANVLGWVIAWLLRYVIVLVKFIAGLPFATAYTVNPLVAWWLVLVYIIFAVSYALKGKKPLRPVLPVCLSVMALCGTIFFSMVFLDTGKGMFTAIDVGQGQCIAIISKTGTVVVDCGGTGTNRNAGDTAADYLLGQGRGRIDLLVLTHFHKDHAGGVEALFSRLDVRRIALSIDMSDDDGLRDKILELARTSGTEIIYVTENLEVAVGGITLKLFAPLGSTDSNERGIIVMASIGDFDALITGDVNATVERKLLSLADLPDTELLIVGHHGSRYSTSQELLDAATPESAIISVGYNSYGHPTSQVLNRLDDVGIDIYRTDLMGNISIRLN
ncbi:MAG: DNA internalization-related competence protein ComEC/Rec2 [Oscillospiraceae bacterium]